MRIGGRRVRILRRDLNDLLQDSRTTAAPRTEVPDAAAQFWGGA